jgi:hypothetical protein
MVPGARPETGWGESPWGFDSLSLRGAAKPRTKAPGAWRGYGIEAGARAFFSSTLSGPEGSSRRRGVLAGGVCTEARDVANVEDRVRPPAPALSGLPWVRLPWGKAKSQE